MWPAPTPRKKTIAAETDTEKKTHQRCEGGTSQETEEMKGGTDNLHRGGVAVIVTRKVENTLLEWKPVNDRLMKVRFNSKFAKLTLIACYAPTEETEEELKI